MLSLGGRFSDALLIEERVISVPLGLKSRWVSVSRGNRGRISSPAVPESELPLYYLSLLCVCSDVRLLSRSRAAFRVREGGGGRDWGGERGSVGVGVGGGMGVGGCLSVRV